MLTVVAFFWKTKKNGGGNTMVSGPIYLWRRNLKQRCQELQVKLLQNSNFYVFQNHVAAKFADIQNHLPPELNVFNHKSFLIQLHSISEVSKWKKNVAASL